MTEEEKKTIAWEKHPGRVAQRTVKEQSSVQPTVQSTEQHSVQPTEQSTEQHSVQSNGAYVYGVGILAVLAIGVCVFFAYKITPQAAKKKQVNEKQDQPPKRRLML